MKRVVVTAVSFLVLVPAALGVLHNGWFGDGVPVRVPSHASLSDYGSDQRSEAQTVEPIGKNHAHPKTSHKHHEKHHDRHGDDGSDRPETAVVARDNSGIESALLPTRSSLSKHS